MIAFTNEYKADMHRHIDELFTQAKALKTSRESRLEASDALVEAYFAHCGRVPDSAPLERLATLILRDEMTDVTPWKTRNTEYPIESKHKEKRYYDKILGSGIPETIASDGKDHRTPTRRVRTNAEKAYVDRQPEVKSND